MKKPYEKPAVIHSAPIEARAAVCAKTNEACRTNGGPVYS